MLAPLLSEAEELDAGTPSATAAPMRTCTLKGCLSRIGLSSEASEVPEWKVAVDDSLWYTASCFAYSLAGGLLLLRPEPLERHMPIFPWRLAGLAIFSNGFFSYMSDVETWGRPSAWKAADTLLATVNSLLQISIVVLASLGHATFPPEPVGVLGASIAIALVCKWRSAAAVRRSDCDAFLRWHSAWHYTLPAGAIVGQLMLHRRCDWSTSDPCPCPRTGH
jgi:hypothetical protein